MLEMLDIPPQGGIQYFKIAREESLKSDFRCRVGACLVKGKSIFRGYNKKKTHTRFANPNLHIKTSIHAELDCLIGSKVEDYSGSIIYVYRETKDGKPAMARPCNHCMKFLTDLGVRTIYYSIPIYPYWKSEKI